MGPDFDQVLDRTNTGAAAMEGFRNYLFADQPPITLPCPDEEVVSMWVADMGFACPPAAIDAIRARLEHPILGYTTAEDGELYDAFSGWCAERYDWTPEREQHFPIPGIVPALHSLVELLVHSGQKALTLTPSYAHFRNAVVETGRELVTCGLSADDGGKHRVDLAAFERQVSDPSLRMFFLCHPHNPTGRSWTVDELTSMADLCFENDVLVVSDEIHGDLLRRGETHTPLQKLYPNSEQIITCMSSSKTFNLAGLGLGQIVIPDEELRDIWQDRESSLVNPLSVAATVGVFRDGEPWRQELLAYLDANFAYLEQTLSAELPTARFSVPDATYFAWIDLTSLFSPDINLSRLFAETAGVLVEGAAMFVADAGGHIRMNVACPRSVLAKGLAGIIETSKRSA